MNSFNNIVFSEASEDNMIGGTMSAIKHTLSNEYVIGVLTLLAVVYASRYAPRLPEKVNNVLNNEQKTINIENYLELEAWRG